MIGYVGVDEQVDKDFHRALWRASLRRLRDRVPAAQPQVFPSLTDRGREILNLIAQGHSNPSIVRRLSLSTKTVGNHVSNIFTKLQVADRAQAIIRAREAGLG